MKSWFGEGFWTRVLALAIAVMLWNFVRGEKQSERGIDIRLNVQNKPEHLLLNQSGQSRINIRIKGPTDRVAKIDEQYFDPYVVDLSDLEKGTHLIEIKEDRFKLPFGVYVSQVYPQYLQFDLQTAESKTVPVKPRFVGRLPKAYDMESFKVIPERVKVMGSRSHLSTFSEVLTEDIVLDDRESNFEGDYGLTLASQDKNTRLMAERVRVEVSIKEKSIFTTVSGVDIQLPFNNGDGVRVRPARVNVAISGPASKIEALKKQMPAITLDRIYETGVSKKRAMRVPLVFAKIPDLTIELKPSSVWMSFVPTARPQPRPPLNPPSVPLISKPSIAPPIAEGSQP